MTEFLSTVVQVPVVTCLVWCLLSFAFGFVGSDLVDFIVRKLANKKEVKTK